jgi:hypothetical protein
MECSGPGSTEGAQRFFEGLPIRISMSTLEQVDHKRTFYLLEQLILKHRAHLQTTSVKEVGLFASRLARVCGLPARGQRIVDALPQICPDTLARLGLQVPDGIDFYFLHRHHAVKFQVPLTLSLSLSLSLSLLFAFSV